MRKIILFAAMALTGIAQYSDGAILGGWTFEMNTPADSANSAAGPVVAAEIGTGSFQGVHVSAASDWLTPPGNGSANSYSGNTWAIGDYFQFSTSSIGVTGIGISFDQVGSGTGPRDFKLQYSTNGTTFTDFMTYAVLENVSPNAWSAGTPVLTTSYAYDLSAITALDNQTNIYFRLTDTSTVSTGGGTVAATGTSRVDNVTVVPEAGSAAIIGIGVLGSLLGRRRR